MHVVFLNVVLWILVTCPFGCYPLRDLSPRFRGPPSGTVELPSITKASLDLRDSGLSSKTSSSLTVTSISGEATKPITVIQNITPVAFILLFVNSAVLSPFGPSSTSAQLTHLRGSGVSSNILRTFTVHVGFRKNAFLPRLVLTLKNLGESGVIVFRKR